MNTKRFTMKLKHPNPLFEQWLTEWRDKATEDNSKMQYCYKMALDSLRKYPLPLSTGKDCIILKGFGEKLCKMLDEKLQKHNKYELAHSASVDPMSEEHQHKITPRKVREYVPVIRSGPYAILVTLYKQSLEPNCPGFMFKREIVKHGQSLSDKSFIKPDPGSYYTAWSSMKTLIDKKLVTKASSPAKYSLTDEGVLLAHKLYRSNNTPATASNNGENLIEAVDNKKSSKRSKTKKKSTLTSTQSSSSLTSETQSETESVHYNILQEESFVCAPGSFDIIFLVDKMEVNGNRHSLDDATLAELTYLNIAYEVRHLKVGDYTWICRERETNRELVLPYIVERKRMDDLGRSIKDGRFYEQKFRLKQCSLPNVVYLIESYGDNTCIGLPLSSLEQAAMNTLLHDEFSVKFTNDTKATVRYFAAMTGLLKNRYLDKTLVSCPKSNLSNENEDDLVSLMTFRDFNKAASKNKNLKVQDMFVRMLVQIKGLSVDKALAIVERYPTLQVLKLAYSENNNLDGEKLLANIEHGKLGRKIGPALSKTVFQLFNNRSY